MWQDWANAALPITEETREIWIEKGKLYLRTHPNECDYRVYSGDTYLTVERDGLGRFRIMDLRIARIRYDLF